MCKLIIVILLVLSMILAACGEKPAEDATTIPTKTVTAEVSAETETTEAPSVEIPGFADYVCVYEDQRDLAWEQDVVFFAKAFLGDYPADGHPLLVNDDSRVYKTGGFMSMANFYQEDMRVRFIEQVYSLLDRIPELSDLGILYEMQRITAELSDTHSSVNLPITESFAFTVEPIYSDNGVQLHAVRLPSEYSDALYGQLVSINGVSIEDVIDGLSKYISHENEYWMMFRLTNIIWNDMITRKGSLQAIGVVGDQDDTAVFEFVTVDGEHIFAELPAVTPEEYRQIDKIMGDWYASDQFSYSHYASTYYWYDYAEPSGTLYIRFNWEIEKTDYRYSDFIADFREAASGNAEKLIVDLRFNAGGNMQVSQDFVDAFMDMDFEQIYILIDGGSCSNAVTLAAELRQKLPNSLLVGTPAGQPANFFAAAHDYPLPNSGYTFAVSDMWYEYWTDYEYDALMPDITVYQTLEDYKNGIDTVLEYVKNR